ncbi:MAG: bifunctional (p)ppGpp synthetase/guanosine-3',5'-bis(diphosphate) 3'-pyrophosphohydrolase [Maricaulaceae bacterium]
MDIKLPPEGETKADGASAPKASFLRQYELVDMVRAYDPSANEALLNKAYVFSIKAHGDQKRHSGDPYYAHPIQVAGILASLNMDVASVCTALLHDVIEDTDTTREELAEMFTEEIAELVDGVTKLSQLELSKPDLSRERKQAENFQKFVLAMSKDVRVLLVKLSDRLHNMRTLGFHPKQSSRERIARETLEIYAPLARRVGVDRICSELEDLSFKHLNPAMHESINSLLSKWRADQSTAISQISIALKDCLDVMEQDYRIYGREKRAYAIWRKLERQGITFDDVADIYAFRILVDSRAECYRVLGHLHTHFRCVPARFRDFISVPKANGYQSLHTTILGPENRRIEIQIRTERMEDVAERGIAAHWAYKNENYSYDPDSAQASGGDPLRRIRPLVEMMEMSGDADDFLEHAKLEMFTDQVFTFTPDGDLIPLPLGATILDFAYAVHTDVGDTCIGAAVNGREWPMHKPLKNGDVVRIIRGGKAEARPDWESLVITGKARSALRRLTRTQEANESRDIGKMLVQHAFAREGKEYAEPAVQDALKRLSLEDTADLYEGLGRGALSMRGFMDAVFPGRSEASQSNFVQRDVINDDSVTLYVKGDGLSAGASMHLSRCCSPIPGDRIVGVMVKGEGLMIHTIDCEKLVAFEHDMDSWVNLAWRRAASVSVGTARVIATVEHVPGALADVTKLIGDAGGNMINISTINRSPLFFDMILDVEVNDKRHLSQIIAALRTSIYVVNTKRADAIHIDASLKD